MTIAANQPYLFPYLGYFQLIAAADKMVMCDSMQYVRRSWINRNTLLVGGKRFLITASVNKFPWKSPINKIEYCRGFFDGWLDTIYYNYVHAPFFNQVMPVLENIAKEEIVNVAEVNIRSILSVFRYLNKDVKILRLSQLADNSDYDKSDRMINIVKQLGGDRYINLPGGSALYSGEYFARRGVELKFLKPYLPPYRQVRTAEFHPGLSIIDVIMNCSPEETGGMIYNASFS